MKLLPPDVNILRIKCTQFDFGWGSAPDPARGTYNSPLDHLFRFKGAASTGEEEEEKEGKSKVGRGGKERGRPYRLWHPASSTPPKKIVPESLPKLVQNVRGHKDIK